MYRLNSEQRQIVEQAVAVVAAQIGGHAADVDRNASFPRESIAALADGALLGLTIPASFGGLGQNFRTMAATLDVLAQHCSSTAMVYLMHLAGVACYAAAPDKMGQHLRAAAAGKHLSTLAFSEKGSRSHFWAPVSRAATDGNGGMRLNATKSFVTSAGEADGYVVSTLAAEGKLPTDSTLYVVLRDDKGLAVSGRWSGLGMRGNASAPMTLENVRVGPDRALTEPGKGLDLMLGVALPTFQVGSAAVAIGIAEAAVQATISHVTQARFEESQTALCQLPTVRARVAQMRIETDRARAHLVSVLDSLESPGPATQLMVLEAKAAATEAAVTVTDMAMRTCGGAAFGGAHGIERMFRDARAPIIMAPTSDQAYDFIGRALCGMELL
jgi:alkylation response protein AidB-like acyl-CoA dehydrogenase